MSQEATQPKPARTWRKVLAAIFDFFTILFAAGYGVAYFSGGLTENGFQLNGGPAFLAFAIIIAYFVVFSKFLGGTLWQRIFGVR